QPSLVANSEPSTKAWMASPRPLIECLAHDQHRLRSRISGRFSVGRRPQPRSSYKPQSESAGNTIRCSWCDSDQVGLTSISLSQQPGRLKLRSSQTSRPDQAAPVPLATSVGAQPTLLAISQPSTKAWVVSPRVLIECLAHDHHRSQSRIEGC